MVIICTKPPVERMTIMSPIIKLMHPYPIHPIFYIDFINTYYFLFIIEFKSTPIKAANPAIIKAYENPLVNDTNTSKLSFLVIDDRSAW